MKEKISTRIIIQSHNKNVNENVHSTRQQRTYHFSTHNSVLKLFGAFKFKSLLFIGFLFIFGITTCIHYEGKIMHCILKQ